MICLRIASWFGIWSVQRPRKKREAPMIGRINESAAHCCVVPRHLKSPCAWCSGCAARTRRVHCQKAGREDSQPSCLVHGISNVEYMLYTRVGVPQCRMPKRPSSSLCHHNPSATIREIHVAIKSIRSLARDERYDRQNASRDPKATLRITVKRTYHSRKAFTMTRNDSLRARHCL